MAFSSCFFRQIFSEYSKISLKYWMRAYLILKKDVENNLNIIKQYQSKEEILKLLTKSVTNKNIKKIIKNIKVLKKFHDKYPCI